MSEISRRKYSMVFCAQRSSPEQRAGLGIYVLVSAVALVLVGLYVGWVFYSRWQANQAIAEHAAEKQRSKDQQTFEAMQVC